MFLLSYMKGRHESHIVASPVPFSVWHGHVGDEHKC